MRKQKKEDRAMIKTTSVIAVAVLMAGTGAALAGSNKGGASSFTPGDQMRDTGTKSPKGASEYTPGDQMKDTAVKPKTGASTFSPGDTMNDKRKK